MTPIDAVRHYAELAKRGRAEFTIIGQHPDLMWTHARGILAYRATDHGIVLASNEVEWHFIQDSIATPDHAVYGHRHVLLTLHASHAAAREIGSLTSRDFQPGGQIITLVGLDALETVSVGHAISARGSNGAHFSIRLAECSSAWPEIERLGGGRLSALAA